jgi:hypothetical protein
LGPNKIVSRGVNAAEGILRGDDMSRTIASSLALSALVVGSIFAIGAARAQGTGTQSGVGLGANGHISTGVPALSPLTQDGASAKAGAKTGSSAHIKQLPTQSSSRSGGANADTGAAMQGGHGGADLRGNGKANGGATLN